MRSVLPLSRPQERWLYGAGAALLASGAAWIITHYFFARPGAFGVTPNPLEPWWLRLHGAAMMVFLVVFGTLLPGHVTLGWRLQRFHRSGMTLIVAVALLAVTGWCLYYVGDDGANAWLGVLHWSLGLAAAAALVFHAVRARRARGLLAAAKSPGPAVPRSAPAGAAAHRRD